jgi:hypothetical protein
MDDRSMNRRPPVSRLSRHKTLPGGEKLLIFSFYHAGMRKNILFTCISQTLNLLRHAAIPTVCPHTTLGYRLTTSLPGAAPKKFHLWPFYTITD